MFRPCFRISPKSKPTNLLSYLLVTAYVWDFHTWFIEIPIYKRYLEGKCLSSHVQFRDLMCSPATAQLPGVQAVIDCTGHWSAREFQVGEVIPVRGQSLLLPVAPLQFAVGAGEYILAPRSDGILFGSLWQAGDDGADARDSDTNRLLAELRAWSRSPLLEQANLRTSRNSVRSILAGVRPYLESGNFVRADSRSDGHAPIVHNIGHGGSGVGLSWGQPRRWLCS